MSNHNKPAVRRRANERQTRSSKQAAEQQATYGLLEYSIASYKGIVSFVTSLRSSTIRGYSMKTTA